MKFSYAIAKFFELPYRLLNATGLIHRPLFRGVFIQLYWIYKRYIEDPFSVLSREHPELFSGGYILDIGANVGYTAAVFSSVADPSFQVIAFEPDENNYAILQKIAESNAARAKILPVHAAVGASSGVVRIWQNFSNPADHRILTPEWEKKNPNGFFKDISLISIDQYLKDLHDSHPIKFVKVDVQGYEESVLDGMLETISRNPNLTLALEYCPSAMVDLGYKPNQFIEKLKALKFISPYHLSDSGFLSPSSYDIIQEKARKEGYVNFLVKRDLN